MNLSPQRLKLRPYNTKLLHHITTTRPLTHEFQMWLDLPTYLPFLFQDWARLFRPCGAFSFFLVRIVGIIWTHFCFSMGQLSTRGPDSSGSSKTSLCWRVIYHCLLLYRIWYSEMIRISHSVGRLATPVCFANRNCCDELFCFANRNDSAESARQNPLLDFVRVGETPAYLSYRPNGSHS